ncbi:MAG: hypothetical protein ACLGH8_10575 [Bacteroidia bacterium]
MKRTLHTIEMLLHGLITGIVVLLSFKLMSAGMYYPGGIILGFSLISIFVTLNWKRLKMAPATARLLCYYLEGFALLVNWAAYHSIGNETLARISLIAAIMLPFIGFTSSIKTHRNKKRAA